jgi:hypothetical protein
LYYSFGHTICRRVVRGCSAVVNVVVVQESLKFSEEFTTLV